MHNGLHLRRHPVRRSRIGAAVAIQVFSHSLATDVTKDAVPEGPREHLPAVCLTVVRLADSRKIANRSADAVLADEQRRPNKAEL